MPADAGRAVDFAAPASRPVPTAAAQSRNYLEASEQTGAMMDLDGQNTQDAGPPASPPIELAKRKTKTIRKKLQVAGAELHLSNVALERHLPGPVKHGDVAHALAQRGTIEEKVVQAADELAVVNSLLQDEVAERERLERELRQARQQRP
jgi:C4-dicarboxylate-specific signal transduction histidine kinase